MKEMKNLPRPVLILHYIAFYVVIRNVGKSIYSGIMHKMIFRDQDSVKEVTIVSVSICGVGNEAEVG